MALTKRRPLPFFSTKPNGPERGTLKKIKKKKKNNTVTQQMHRDAIFRHNSAPGRAKKPNCSERMTLGGPRPVLFPIFYFFYYFSLPTDSNLYVHLSDFGPRLNRPVNLENRFCWRSFPLKIGCFVIELFSLGWFLVCFIFGRTFYVHVNS